MEAFTGTSQLLLVKMLNIFYYIMEYSKRVYVVFAYLQEYLILILRSFLATFFVIFWLLAADKWQYRVQ